MREILFVAGEASGDLHAAGVARALVESGTPLRLTGIGGDEMQRVGVTLLEHAERLAVMGFVEVLRHVPRHWALLRTLKRRIRSGEVALLVLVDYPGFNMKLAEAAAAAGVPVLYYITPQVWAWGAGRLEKLAAWVTKAAVILPFEEALLRAHHVDATFVGHPLLDRAGAMPSRADARAALGLPARAPVLALYPGSRAQEVARHLDDFVAAARAVEARVPGLQVIVRAAATVSLDPARCPYPIVDASSFTVLRAADVALCKSGTTTLEAAVAACPLAVGYKTSALTYAAARRLVKVPHIGLVNVVAGREVAPEFVQGDFQPERVAAALVPLIPAESPARAAMLEGLSEVRGALGTPGAAARVAAVAMELTAGVS